MTIFAAAYTSRLVRFRDIEPLMLTDLVRSDKDSIARGAGCAEPRAIIQYNRHHDDSQCGHSGRTQAKDRNP
jgi:hypothetical protein